jgi:hypothetical protein
MRQRLAILTVVLAVPIRVLAASAGEWSPPARAALAFLEGQVTMEIDTFLTGLRPDPLDVAARAQVVASLPRKGELRPSARELAKITEAERVLDYSARKGVILVKIIDLDFAFIGLYYRTVLLISRQQLAVLDADEFEALAAHEIGHDYHWNEYRAAMAAQDHIRRQELELRADGLAVLTLRGMGVDPEHLVSAIQKTMRHNEGRAVAANAEDYVGLVERIAFIRAVAAKWPAGAQLSGTGVYSR